MEAERYVILKRALGDGDGRLERVDAGVAEELNVWSADLTPSQAVDELAAPGVVGGRAMPLHLIHPRGISGVARPTHPGCTWGVEAVGAAQSECTGAGITVAVLDTGIDANHEVFQGANVIQRDFTGTGNGDTVGHGTHCAGTIAGRSVNGYRIGVAPGVEKILAGKVLGGEGGTTEVLLRAIQWALDEGANIISMSLGIDFPGQVARAVDRFGMSVQEATSRALEDYRSNLMLFGAIANYVRAFSLIGRPVVVVAATGNESARSAPHPYTVSIAPPAASDGFVGVGAVEQYADGSLAVAEFSNTGPSVVGPGVDILSATPGGKYQLMSGTSMATPHVAGVAALWAERLLTKTQFLTADGLTASLRAHSSFHDSFASLDVGQGLVQAPA